MSSCGSLVAHVRSVWFPNKQTLKDHPYSRAKKKENDEANWAWRFWLGRSSWASTMSHTFANVINKYGKLNQAALKRTVLSVNAQAIPTSRNSESPVRKLDLRGQCMFPQRFNRWVLYIPIWFPFILTRILYIQGIQRDIWTKLVNFREGFGRSVHSKGISLIKRS